MYLCQTVFLPFCRRRSGLRRDGTEEKTAAEVHKTARSNNITIEIKTLRSNDRFGLNFISENLCKRIKLSNFATDLGFRSSVGLEQRPSKAWV